MRYFLLPLLLAVLQTANAQDLPGLIVKYKMDNSCELVDEIPGSPVYGVLNDISPAPDHGNSPNTALAFNVNTSYITLGVVDKLKLAGDKSISFLIKPAITGAARTGGIFSYGNAILIGYLEQSSIPKLTLKFGNTQYQVVNLENQWQKVTVTFVKDFSSTKSKASVYINGILSSENEQNKSAQNFTNVIALMGPVGQTALTNGFRGTLDDMRFYNRALTGVEILNAALPVNLESFTARRIKGMIELSWKTSDEENFSHFSVQSSIDGVQFETINKVDGGKDNYTAYDAAPPDTDVWYRLEMVDRDEKKKLSKIIKVGRRNMTEVPTISVFPNPAGEALYFKGMTSNHTINIISPSGSLLKQKLTANKIDIPELGPGLYYIVIYDGHGNKILATKFIKRKD
ncbi:MAG TPA: LamG-like jellyroll fold domain-containing protein [Flavitalea sp.]|nr:LamG-like jellyroll fold domain-containing protein [Flavitalea sp.]